MNQKKIIILGLIVITLIIMGVIFFNKPSHLPVLATEEVPEKLREEVKVISPAPTQIQNVVEEKKLETSDKTAELIQQFRHVLPKISDIKSKKIDTHRPGIILYEMVDQLSELEDLIRQKASVNDMASVEQIVAVYSKCAQDKQYYLPARALCLERIQSHSKDFKIPYNPKDFPIDVRSLLSTPDKL
jgi:hypothetical protein